MKLSEVDKEVIAVLPSGWFNALDLPYHIRCREYRCDRLKELGVLQSRVVGDINNLTTEYNKEIQRIKR